MSPSKLAQEGFKGEIVVGEYVKRVPNEYGKDDFEFVANDGRTVIVNHCGHLGFLADKLEMKPGDICQVIYHGKSTYKGKESHEFELNIA